MPNGNSVQQAWENFYSTAGYRHPAVAPQVRMPLSEAPDCIKADCSPQEQREQGYWPMPWVEMPPGGLPFDPFGFITTPAANGTETLVLQFRVPKAWDGIILGVTNFFTGPGFVEGSGDLIWRIRIGQPNIQGGPQRNYDNIQNTLGASEEPRTVQGGIIITSNQFIEYTVTHAIGSPIVPAGTRIGCNVQGYYWPRGSSPIT